MDNNNQKYTWINVEIDPGRGIFPGVGNGWRATIEYGRVQKVAQDGQYSP